MPVIAVHPVNLKRDTVGGIKVYPSVLDIPGDVELALITLLQSAVWTSAGGSGNYGRLR